MNSIPVIDNNKETNERLRQERDKAEKSLVRTERHYRLLLENSQDIVIIVTDQGTILDVTKPVGQILGYDQTEWFGKNIFEYIHPNSREAARLSLKKAVKEPEVAKSEVFHFTRKDGGPSRIFASITIGMLAPGSSDEVTYIVINSRDITENIETEERLKVLNAAIRQTAEMVVITNSEGVVEFVNPAFENITGYKMGEILGKSMRILKSGRHPEEFYKQMWDTINSGKVWRGELLNKDASGELYDEEMTISPVQDSQGKITHFVAIKRDISEEKKMEEQLSHTEKISSIGTFVAGVAHEINNPLTVIAGHSHILMKQKDIPDDIKEKLGTIAKHSDRCIKIVQQLLKFTRKQKSGRVKISLNEVMASTLELYAYLLEKDNISLKTIYKQTIPMALADENQLQQVFMNIIVNAHHEMVKHKVKGGEITITTDSDNDFVRATIKNDGPTIPPEIFDKIFDPFFTTKQVGKGTGLGLSVSFGIIRNHNGKIRVENVSTGVQFIVEVPVIPNPNPQSLTPNP